MFHKTAKMNLPFIESPGTLRQKVQMSSKRASRIQQLAALLSETSTDKSAAAKKSGRSIWLGKQIKIKPEDKGILPGLDCLVCFVAGERCLGPQVGRAAASNGS